VKTDAILPHSEESATILLRDKLLKSTLLCPISLNSFNIILPYIHISSMGITFLHCPTRILYSFCISTIPVTISALILLDFLILTIIKPYYNNRNHFQKVRWYFSLNHHNIHAGSKVQSVFKYYVYSCHYSLASPSKHKYNEIEIFSGHHFVNACFVKYYWNKRYLLFYDTLL
jgi:hypothetical protein